jgi:hypothetical protein
MKMTRSAWLQILIVVVFAFAALLLVRLHNAGGATLEHPPIELNQT